MSQLTFLLAEHPASHSALQDCGADWQTRVATSCLPILPLLTNIAPSGWYGRTSPAFCRQTGGGISPPSSTGWQNSGMGSHTAFLTLNTSESRSGAAASSLSAILEAGNVPQRYYLSAKACNGILQRAELRKKTLPPLLKAALVRIAKWTKLFLNKP